MAEETESSTDEHDYNPCKSTETKLGWFQTVCVVGFCGMLLKGMATQNILQHDIKKNQFDAWVALPLRDHFRRRIND